ncbi:hypothetical protein [Reichenbachiella sp. MSK19-1]|uniref:hypothetical protein n=1 Tax=Reichenbachiella sp. MSK19-1 TaxID=1897631 RepID=UPI000E6B9210|nr:hypothetical protein [Reichenbachiella sp. MSK19-1]RJE71498.1 hypothetical protein BGP76_05210 [Reichenbachiella sp. MSK19-1]
MKKILIYTFLIFATLESFAQVNVLSKTQFENIKVNGKTLKQIRDAKADVTKVEALFGSAESMTISLPNQMPWTASFEYLGMLLWYDNMQISDTETAITLTNLTIDAPNRTVTINGRSVKVGDKILNLSNIIVKDTKKENLKSIIYVDDPLSTELFYVHFDSKTKKITKIGYFIIP